MTRNRVSSALVPLLAVSLIAGQTPQVTSPAEPAASANPGSSQPPASDHILQDGTPVKLQLTKTLTSADAKTGQELLFEVVDDIDVDGVTILHRGVSATGVVTEAQASKRMGRAGKLNFTINSVPLADNEKVALRAVNDSKGDSKVAGMTSLMLNMPLAAAPFFLLIKGGNTAIPKGTQITAFVNGDVQLDLSKFGTAPQPAVR